MTSMTTKELELQVCEELPAREEMKSLINLNIINQIGVAVAVNVLGIGSGASAGVGQGMFGLGRR